MKNILSNRLQSIAFHRSEEMGSAFALQRTMDKRIYLGIQDSMLNFRNQHPNASNTEIFVHLQNCIIR